MKWAQTLLILLHFGTLESWCTHQTIRMILSDLGCNPPVPCFTWPHLSSKGEQLSRALPKITRLTDRTGTLGRETPPQSLEHEENNLLEYGVGKRKGANKFVLVPPRAMVYDSLRWTGEHWAAKMSGNLSESPRSSWRCIEAWKAEPPHTLRFPPREGGAV